MQQRTAGNANALNTNNGKAKKPSHKPTDGNIDHQPRFVTQTAFNTEHLNQFPIIEYRQEANISPSKYDFQLFWSQISACHRL